MNIPDSDVKYSHSTNQHRIFAIKSPLTNIWHEMPMSKTDCLPKHVCDFVDYYQLGKYVFENARKYSPMNKDLLGLSVDECRIFGVRQDPNLNNWYNLRNEGRKHFYRKDIPVAFYAP